MSVRPEDIATVGYIDGVMRLMLANVAQLAERVVELANRPADDYLSIQEVAKTTYSSVNTVTGWIKVGKPGPDGQLVKLPVYRFGEHDRVKRADLEAFGKIHEQAGQEKTRSTRPTPPPPRRPKSQDRPDGAPLMRVA